LSFRPQLDWMEGKKEFGCRYHKLCRFNHDRGRIQVDLFVMKVIAERRPIAVTISNYDRNGTELGREKLGFTAVEEATAGVPTIAKALVSVGFAPESKAEPYARGVVEYISDHGEELSKALGKMEP